MRPTSMIFWLVIMSICAMTPLALRADVLLDETNLVAQPQVAVPVEHAFSATTVDALTVTLTDLQTPAAFTSLQIAVTLGDALVGSANVPYTQGTAAATVAVPAAAGNYVLRVIGVPNATQGFGSFGVCVTSNADVTHTCIAGDSYSGTIVAPATPSSSGSSTLNTSFTTTAAGSYVVTLIDDAFPAALQSAAAGVSLGSTPVNVAPILAGTPTTLTLAANTTYQLLVGAVANSMPMAGLYGVRITDPSGAAVFDHTVPVGGLGPAKIVTNSSAQTLTLTLADEGYPAPLASLGAAVTLGGLPALAELTAAGTAASGAPVPAGTLEVWTSAVAAAQAGVYNLTLSGAAASLLSATQVVNPAASAASPTFAFLVNLPSPGSYSVADNDFLFPSALQSLGKPVVAQSGVVLPQNNGVFTVTQAGNAIVVVDAQAPQSGSGIFGVTISTTGPSAQTLLDQTQAVGGTFETRTVNVPVAAAYDVTLADLGFPTQFSNLAMTLSRGAQVLGSIYGAGTFPISATPGQYVLTFIATPGAQSYGLYSVQIASAAPSVTFSSAPTSVAPGPAGQRPWCAPNATACSASGATGWSASEPTSGTAAVVINASVSLTLTCVGPGGSASQSVNITATPAPTGSGHGGAFDLTWIGILAGLVARRALAPGSSGAH